MNKKVCDQFRLIRKVLRLTQTQLADLSGVPVNDVARFVRIQMAIVKAAARKNPETLRRAASTWLVQSLLD